MRQVLATGAPAFTKYANVALERLSYGDMLAVWSEVTGRPAPAVLIQCTADNYAAVFGPAAAELALQFRYSELCDPWAEREGEFLGIEELGIKENEVVGFQGAIERLHRGLNG